MSSKLTSPLELGPGELPSREDCERLRATGSIDLWWTDLDNAAGVGSRACSILAPAERARADRLRDRQTRRRAVARRVGLRRLLGAYLGCDPAGLELPSGRWGRPRLAPTWSGLDFNVASAGRSAVYALAWGRAVGVDVEEVAVQRGEEPLARLFASADEQRELARRVRTSGTARLLALWTRKEALAKAIGPGLTLPLEELEIGTEAAMDGPILHGPWRRFAASWRVAAVPAPPWGVAAVAAAGGWTTITSRRFGVSPSPQDRPPGPVFGAGFDTNAHLCGGVWTFSALVPSSQATQPS